MKHSTLQSKEKYKLSSHDEIKEVSSEELVGSKGELIIYHNDSRYSLKVTANNKLILTK